MDLSDALIDWDDPADANGNVGHVAAHGLTPAEVESVLFSRSANFDTSHASGLPVAFGHTDTGRFIIVVFDVLCTPDPLVVHPVTAYEVPEPA